MERIPEKGEMIRHLPTQANFCVTRRTKFGSRVKLNDQFWLEDCGEVPDEIQTAIDLVNHILAGEESIEWLSALDQEFKGQLWLHLTDDQKEGLKRLKRQAEETNRAA